MKDLIEQIKEAKTLSKLHTKQLRESMSAEPFDSKESARLCDELIFDRKKINRLTLLKMRM